MYLQICMYVYTEKKREEKKDLIKHQDVNGYFWEITIMDDFFLFAYFYFLMCVQELWLTWVKSEENCQEENWVAVAEDNHLSSDPAFTLLFFALSLIKAILHRKYIQW